MSLIYTDAFVQIEFVFKADLLFLSRDPLETVHVKLMFYVSYCASLKSSSKESLSALFV